MLGVTVALLLACSSFALGVLWVNWRADYLVIWQEPASQTTLLDALHFYSNTVGAEPAKYTAVFLAVGTVQTVILLFKMLVGKETNWLFDGASLCTCNAHTSVLVVAMGILLKNKLFPFIDWIPSVIPPPPANPLGHFQTTLTTLREAAIAHVLLVMALIGVVLLQGGKYYSERLHERERNEEVDARLVRRLRQLQQEERQKNSEGNPAAAPSPGGGEAST